MTHQGGFSLLEVMIASVLLAVAMLGLAALSVRVMEDSAASREELAAGMLLHDLRGRYHLFGRRSLLSTSMAGTPGNSADPELSDWHEQVSRTLPSGQGIVCIDSTPDDGVDSAPACDHSGHTVGKIFWIRADASEPRRRVGVLN